MSAEYACGQIIFNLKNSNLHYLIEETHKSAYITIRKKLIEESREAPREVIVDNRKRLDDNIRMENGLLKQEINDIKIKCANLEVERDEVEIKTESLSEAIDALEDKLEDAYGESRKLKDTINELKVEMCEKLKLKDVEKSEIQKASVKIKVSKEKLEFMQKQSEETILMLENVVETERLKVKQLENDITCKRSCEKCENTSVVNFEENIQKNKLHGTEDAPSTSKCGSCDYESDNENDVNKHFKIKHAFVCDVCELIFKNEVKLNTHVCRITVANPTYGDYYIKNWIISKSCARIFSNSQKLEVAFLHSPQCINHTNTCQDLISDIQLPNYIGNYLGHPVWHAPLDDFFSNGSIHWELLSNKFSIKIT